ncbi:MAG: macro domain-containing protein [Gemmataceae bacterium]|nr:macro domain-containing protein [Gemmataceae bacterium]
MIENLWLVHPDAAMCAAFGRRCAGLRGVRVVQSRFEELEPHDCFVTAGNAFGLMTAGIDAAVVRVFGEQIMTRVQQRILNDYFGEQPVGTAFVLPTNHAAIPFLCHAPTMRVPGSIDGTDKVYCATWAALLAVQSHNTSHPEGERIETVAFPAMGTGFGGVPFDEAARQMAAAWRSYCEPPHRLDWDFVVERHRAICYDGNRQVAK